MIHLGRNPRNGGNPPKDKRFIGRKRFKVRLLLVWFIKWEIE